MSSDQRHLGEKLVQVILDWLTTVYCVHHRPLQSIESTSHYKHVAPCGSASVVVSVTNCGKREWHARGWTLVSDCNHCSLATSAGSMTGSMSEPAPAPPAPAATSTAAGRGASGRIRTANSRRSHGLMNHFHVLADARWA